MAKLGILFNIAELGGGAYGHRAYSTLFNIIDPALLYECTLRDGDVGNWDRYCIAIESFDSAKLNRIKSAVFRSNAKGLIGRQQRFIDERNVDNACLVIAGYIDGRGVLQHCETWFVRQAWDEANKTHAHGQFSEFATTLTGANAAVPGLKQDLSEHSPGQIFGRQYLILDVRRGGMGLVYIVEDLESLKKNIILRIAFKTFQARYLWDENAIQRFEREALNWVQLGKHPNLVHALVVQQIEAKPYIWLEFVDGVSLAERLSESRLNVSEALDIALQFCSGIRYAHEKHSMIHRDIKPGNIMISHEGVVKITDFGLSKIQAEFAEAHDRRTGVPLDPDQTETLSNIYVTGSGMCVGTPAYIAPEAILNPPSVDARADIYSFGIVLFEMLTGTRPFRGPHILEQQVRTAPTTVRTLNSDVSLQLDHIVNTCLAKDPDHRYPSFAHLENALREVSGDQPKTLPGSAHTISEKEQRLLQGFSFMELGKYQEAIHCFQDVLKIEDKAEEAYNNIGVCLGHLECFEEAAEYFEKAVSIRAEYPEAWSNLGSIYYRLKRYEDGIRACNRAIVLKPDWAEAQANKGANLLALSQFEEAMSCFESSIRIDPKYWKGYLHAGEAYAKRGNPNEALSLLNKALAIAPREAYVLALTAACLYDLGQKDEAKRFLARAQQVDPRHPIVAEVTRLVK